MTICWNTCAICGKGFASTDPRKTDCGDRNGHARLEAEKRRRKDDKDGGKR